MKILLVQHKGLLTGADAYTRSSSLEPLALEYLAAAAEGCGHTAMVKDDVGPDDLINILHEFHPDVVGFTVYSYAFAGSIELARIVKSTTLNGKEAPVTIFGGCHPTACPEEAVSDECVDFAVRGEGEETLCELLEAIETSSDYKQVAGIAFKQNGKLVLTADRKRIADPDTLPFPKRDKDVLERCKQYQISYPPPSRQKSVAQVLYSRGCPFSCSYCAAEISWKRRIVWRDPESVCDELEELIENYGTNLIYFPDLTLNANKRKLIDFCEVLVARNLPLHWWGFFRLDLLDKDILDALVAAKCIKLSMGIESPIQSYAKKIKDHLNIAAQEQREVLNYANKIGMLLRAFLMIGFPSDTEDRILSYSQQMIDYGFDEIRVCFATPFPGTRFFAETKQSGLLPDEMDWSAMTTETPYLIHPTLSKQQLLGLQKKVLIQFYTSRRYSQHVIDKSTRFPRLKQPWVEYLKFLECGGIFRDQEPEYLALLAAIEGCTDIGVPPYSLCDVPVIAQAL